MRTILVTGGAGFIGVNLVRYLLAETAARVVVLDKLTYAGNLQSLEDLEDDPRLAFAEADIADGSAVRRLLREHRPGAIMNLAAESHVDRSIDSPADFIATNLVGTYELLEATREYCKEQDDPGFRLLHISTDEVYGSLGPEGRFEEETPYAPNSPYAATKAGADHLVRAYHHTYGLPVLLTNCSNNYGPYQFPEKLIPLMVLNALEGKPLPIYGDGGNVRDWLYVTDHCAALLRVLEDGLVGERYNVGGDAERTNLEVVEEICSVLERRRPAASNESMAKAGVASYAELKSFVKDRPGHDVRYAIDASKLQAELGWRTSVEFREGLDLTVAWYLEHSEWCEAVQSGSYRRARLGLHEASVEGPE